MSFMCMENSTFNVFYDNSSVSLEKSFQWHEGDSMMTQFSIETIYKITEM